MKRLLAGLVLSAAAFAGCAHIPSSEATYTSVNGDAWFTEHKNIMGIAYDHKVFYCPAPSGGAAKCKEAKLVPQSANLKK